MDEGRPVKVVYVCTGFPPVSGPGIWRALAFTKYLSQRGYSVSVICSDRAHWHERRDESLLQEIPAAVDVTRISSVFLSDIYRRIEKVAESARTGLSSKLARGVLWRLEALFLDQYIHWGLKSTAKVLAEAAQRDVDCIITSGPAHIAHLAGWMVNVVRGVPWVMDYRDLWTDDASLIRETGYQRKLFRRIETAFLRRADAVVAVSPSWVAHLSERVEGSDRAKFHLIRNGHDITGPLPAEGKGRSLTGRLHCHYNGSADQPHHSNILLDALEILKSDSEYRDRLPLCTFSGFPEAFRREIEARGLNDIIVDVGFMPRQKSIEYSQCVDVLMVIVNAERWVSRGTIPAKTYEAIALQRHVFAMVPQTSDVKDLLLEYENSTVCDVESSTSVATGLRELISLYELGHLNAANHSDLSSAFTRTNQTSELEAIIEQVLHAQKRSRVPRRLASWFPASANSSSRGQVANEF